MVHRLNLSRLLRGLEMEIPYLPIYLNCVWSIYLDSLGIPTRTPISPFTHLLFANDLLVFCKAYSNSLVILMRNFHSFSRASGLEVNEVKSSVYISRVASTIKCDVMEFFGMLEGSFTLSPFTQRSSTSIIASLW